MIQDPREPWLPTNPTKRSNMAKSVEARRLKAWTEKERARLTAELAELDEKYPNRHDAHGGVWWQQVQLEMLDTNHAYNKALMVRERRFGGRLVFSRRWVSKVSSGYTYPSRKAYAAKQRRNR